MTSQTSSGIAEHPDIVALRAHSERTASTPAGQAVEGLSLLAGLYVAASPWIVGFNEATTLMVNNLIVGIAFTLLAVGFGSAYERTHGMSWAALGVGAWTVIAPWVVAGDVSSTSTITSNVIAGGVATALALATAAMGASAHQRR